MCQETHLSCYAAGNDDSAVYNSDFYHQYNIIWKNKAVFSGGENDAKYDLVCAEGNGDPMHEVYPTQDTSRMGTTWVKQEEEKTYSITGERNKQA